MKSVAALFCLMSILYTFPVFAQQKMCYSPVEFNKAMAAGMTGDKAAEAALVPCSEAKKISNEELAARRVTPDQRDCDVRYSSIEENESFLNRLLILSTEVLKLEEFREKFGSLELQSRESSRVSNYTIGPFVTLNKERLYTAHIRQVGKTDIDEVRLILQCDHQFKKLRIISFQLTRDGSYLEITPGYRWNGRMYLQAYGYSGKAR